MGAAMSADVDEQLVDELKDLLVVKLALVLVPAQRALQALSRDGLAAAMGKITSNLSADLESILSGYHISKRDGDNESNDI
jgi:hypothetical protein